MACGGWNCKKVSMLSFVFKVWSEKVTKVMVFLLISPTHHPNHPGISPPSLAHTGKHPRCPVKEPRPSIYELQKEQKQRPIQSFFLRRGAQLLSWLAYNAVSAYRYLSSVSISGHKKNLQQMTLVNCNKKLATLKKVQNIKIAPKCCRFKRSSPTRRIRF